MHLKQNHFLKLKKPQVEKVVTNHIPDKSLVSRISFLQPSNKKSSKPIKRRAKTRRHIFQRYTDGQHAHKQIIGEKEIKTTVRYHIMTIKVAINKTQKTSGVGENVQKLTGIHHLWEGKMMQLLWKTVWRLLKKLTLELSQDPTMPFLGPGIPFQENSNTHSHKNLTAALLRLSKNPSVFQPMNG